MFTGAVKVGILPFMNSNHGRVQLRFAAIEFYRRAPWKAPVRLTGLRGVRGRYGGS
jgi:hypothetical protein